MSSLRLFPRQLAAAQSQARELRVYNPGKGGASHLLRVVAIFAAAERRGVRVKLLQRNVEELRRNHLEGAGSLFALVDDIAQQGGARIKADRVEVGDGRIEWSGWSTEAERRKLLEEPVDVLLVDGVDDMPPGLYAALVRKARVRVVAVTSRRDLVGSAGGLLGDSSVDVVELDPGELAPHMVERPTYRKYLENLHPWLDFPRHIEEICKDVDRWIAGDFHHYFLYIPSRHGKTEFGPNNLPGYILRRWPADWCAIASYNVTIAEERNTDARDNYVAAGGKLLHGRATVSKWRTLGRGGSWASGSGGGVGSGASWLFPDDLNKSWLDAMSARQRKKNRSWIGSTLFSRANVFGRGGSAEALMKIFGTNTRWDKADASGYMLELLHGALERDPGAPTVAIRAMGGIYKPSTVENYRKMYPLFEVLDDFRTEPGEPIYPKAGGKIHGKMWWAHRIAAAGPITAASEIDQDPLGVSMGGMFSKANFNRLDVDPEYVGGELVANAYPSTWRCWDLGRTEGAGDATAGAKLGRDREDRIIIRHVVARQLGDLRRNMLIAGIAVLDGPRVGWRIPMDPAASAGPGIQRYMVDVFRKLRMPAPYEQKLIPPRKAATATESAKAGRARDLVSIHTPPGGGVPGNVYYVAAAWRPSVRDVVNAAHAEATANGSKDHPGFDALVKEWPALLEIAKLTEECLREDWQVDTLDELESFTGDEGRKDDRVDAIVDGAEEVAQVEATASVFVGSWGDSDDFDDFEEI